MRILSDDGDHATARAIRVVRVVSTADSRTERLPLLTASNNRHRLTRMYLIKPLLISVVSKEINPALAAQNEQRNK